MHRGADFPFVLCLYKLTNVEHLGHFTVRGTEESTLPRMPQPRLVLNTENGKGFPTKTAFQRHHHWSCTQKVERVLSSAKIAN